MIRYPDSTALGKTDKLGDRLVFGSEGKEEKPRLSPFGAWFDGSATYRESQGQEKSSGLEARGTVSSPGAGLELAVAKGG
jgi:hypothetical protein